MRTRRMFHATLLLLAAPLSLAAADLASVDAAYDAERWTEAAAGYAAAAQADPNNARAWFRLGVARWRLGEHAGAEEAFGRAVGAGVPRSLVDFQLARMLAAAGDRGAALSALEAAARGGHAGAAGLDGEEFAALKADPRYAAAAEAIRFNAAPCEAIDAFRQFDFWIGQWQVVDASDVPQGTNRIEKAEQGCVLTEHWTSAGGGTGQSLNHYDPATGQWHQRWISNGLIIDISGGLVDGSMVLSGHSYYVAQQRKAHFRGTWTPLADGRVRQFFEESADGSNWQTWFEGFYRRVVDEES